MTLATTDDMEVLLGRELSGPELAKAPGALRRASNLVAGYCNRLFVAPVPGPVTDVVAGIALRDITSEDEVDSGEGNKQYTMGPFQLSQGSVSGGTKAWLSSTDRMSLRPYVNTAVSVDMRSEHYIPPLPVVVDGS